MVGVGNIGSKIIKLAQGVGMKVLSANSQTSSDELDKMISKGDIIILALPLNEKTKHLFDRRRIDLMKPSMFLINVARGLIVEQEALYDALVNQRIGGAGLDVFPDDNIVTVPSEEILRFARLKNVVSTPHLAYNTKESQSRLADELITNIKACMDGNPVNVVN